MKTGRDTAEFQINQRLSLRVGNNGYFNNICHSFLNLRITFNHQPNVVSDDSFLQFSKLMIRLQNFIVN